MRRLYPAFIVIVLLALCSCPAPETETKQEPSPYTAEELREIEQHKFSNLYVELETYVEEAMYRTGRLQNFTWPSELVCLGFKEENTNSTEEITTLLEILESDFDLGPVEEHCAKWKTCSNRIWTENPYKEPQTIIEKAEKLTLEEWQALCTNLNTELSASVKQSLACKAAAKTYLDQLADHMERQEWVCDNYLPILQEASARYQESFNFLIDSLSRAEQASGELATWKFNALSTAGSEDDLVPTSPPSTSRVKSSCSEEGEEQDSTSYLDLCQGLHYESSHLSFVNNTSAHQGWGGFWW